MEPAMVRGMKEFAAISPRAGKRAPTPMLVDLAHLFYAESFRGLAHLDALVSEAPEIVGAAIGDRA